MDTDFQNNISDLPTLSDFRYENLFKVYQEDNYYIYNIIHSLSFDSDMDIDYYYVWTVDRSVPWTIVSYIHYESIHLWWLICIMNDILDPTSFPQMGDDLKILKPQYVRYVVDEIINKTNA